MATPSRAATSSTASAKPAALPVRMSLRGYGPGACAASNCVSQEVVVEP